MTAWDINEEERRGGGGEGCRELLSEGFGALQAGRFVDQRSFAVSLYFLP